MEDKNQKYVVIQSLTKGKISAIGGSRWFFRNKKALLIWFAVSFGFFLVMGKLYENHNIIIGLSTLPIFAEYIYVIVRTNIEENKFWDKVKDLPEPKDLREIK